MRGTAIGAPWNQHRSSALYAVIEGWRIVERVGLYEGYAEQQEYDFDQMLRDFDASMPEDDRLGEILRLAVRRRAAVSAARRQPLRRYPIMPARRGLSDHAENGRFRHDLEVIPPEFPHLDDGEARL